MNIQPTITVSGFGQFLRRVYWTKQQLCRVWVVSLPRSMSQKFHLFPICGARVDHVDGRQRLKLRVLHRALREPLARVVFGRTLGRLARRTEVRIPTWHRIPGSQNATR